jgi:acetyltransferase
MKTIQKALLTSKPPKSHPCFGGHPRGVLLDQTKVIKGYGRLKLRPIQLDDEEEMTRFHKDISEENIYLRYFQYLGLDRRTTHERLIRICTNTPESYAIIIERLTKNPSRSNIVAVGRLTKTSETLTAAFDILFSDKEKTIPLGKLLMNHLVKLAQGFGFQVLTSELLVVDHYAINLCRQLGFSVETVNIDSIVRVKLDLC